MSSNFDAGSSPLLARLRGENDRVRAQQRIIDVMSWHVGLIR
jgi:hypothetical protein